MMVKPLLLVVSVFFTALLLKLATRLCQAHGIQDFESAVVVLGNAVQELSYSDYMEGVLGTWSIFQLMVVQWCSSVSVKTRNCVQDLNTAAKDCFERFLLKLDQIYLNHGDDIIAVGCFLFACLCILVVLYYTVKLTYSMCGWFCCLLTRAEPACTKPEQVPSKTDISSQGKLSGASHETPEKAIAPRSIDSNQSLPMNISSADSQMSTTKQHHDDQNKDVVTEVHTIAGITSLPPSGPVLNQCWDDQMVCKEAEYAAPTAASEMYPQPIYEEIQPPKITDSTEKSSVHDNTAATGQTLPTSHCMTLPLTLSTEDISTDPQNQFLPVPLQTSASPNLKSTDSLATTAADTQSNGTDFSQNYVHLTETSVIRDNQVSPAKSEIKKTVRFSIGKEDHSNYNQNAHNNNTRSQQHSYDPVTITRQPYQSCGQPTDTHSNHKDEPVGWNSDNNNQQNYYYSDQYWHGRDQEWYRRLKYDSDYYNHDRYKSPVYRKVDFYTATPPEYYSRPAQGFVPERRVRYYPQASKHQRYFWPRDFSSPPYDPHVNGWFRRHQNINFKDEASKDVKQRLTWHECQELIAFRATVNYNSCRDCFDKNLYRRRVSKHPRVPYIIESCLEKYE